MRHEQDEFADFYRASRDSCLRAVTAVVGDRELAQEQVAEAFTRAWTSWGQVRRHAAPRAWVVRTALNLGVSWWRRRHREVPLADHDAAAPAGAGDGVDPAPSRRCAGNFRLPERTRTRETQERSSDERARRHVPSARVFLRAAHGHA